MTHDSQSSDSTANAPSRGAAAVRNWLIVLLALGIGWRLLRYLLCFPFWLDEAYLNTSVLRRDYAGVLEPLYYFQIAPLLYLWVQRTVFLLLGGGEYALRLYSLLTGIGALLLFWRLVRPHLDPIATNVAVGFFACSYYLVRHTCESKPYASDLLVATLLIWLAVRWWQTPASARWPLLATLASVPAVWLSYPGVFVACGVSLATLVASVRSKRARAWALWLVYNVLVAASFLCFLLVFVAVHSARAADSWLEDWWRDAFPPRASIGAFLWWLVKIHTGRMFAYPHGGPHFASTLTTVLFLVGAITLVVRRRHWFVLLFVGMSLATLLAAALERYPYGGSVRVSIYFAPLICLMAGLGAATLIDHVLPLRARDGARGGHGGGFVGLGLVGSV
ncbi:MAG: glycosyltransferase family 39 protein, partial [Phycisphaerae bacterium]